MSSLIRQQLATSKRYTMRFILGVTVVLVVVYLFSGVFSIAMNEVGVLQRFGRVVEPQVQPGIHFALPWPVDTISKIPVRMVNRVFIDDFFEGAPTATAFYNMTGLSTYCISGDNNIVTINCVLQYTISDPVSYLFNVKDGEIALRALAANTILQCLAGLPVDEILTYGKRRIETCIMMGLQEQLDSLETGLSISFVELKDVRPPRLVQEYFDDVINAQIDQRKTISKAESYRNEKMPDANARADRLLREADAYKQQVIATASGEAQRFLDVLSEYTMAKSVTRQRLYIETMQDILASVDKKYIVTAGPKGPSAQFRFATQQ
ncbi:FtsH protease activity modulator HflK [bacterium]|nr:FtsH protease activity modulator HflK [candidate division CSSED10-310 bacterium]